MEQLDILPPPVADLPRSISLDNHPAHIFHPASYRSSRIGPSMSIPLRLGRSGPMASRSKPTQISNRSIIRYKTRPHPACSRRLERVHRLVGRPPRVSVAERPDRNTRRRIDGTSHVPSGIGRSPESVLRSEDCSHIESPRVKNIEQMPFADHRSMIRK